MRASRVIGVLILLLSVYYAQFFALRREPATFAQIAALWSAAAFLLLQRRPATPQAAWFTGWRPRRWQGWLLTGAALTMAGAIFQVMDAGSHSVSDTLTRVAPTYSLLAAVFMKLLCGRGAPATN
jgi:hypothetical protein